MPSNNTSLGNIPASDKRTSGLFGEIDAKRESITSESIQVYGANGNFRETYLISDHADLLDAIGQAQSDLPTYGGTIQFAGVHQASTQLVVEKPITLTTHGEVYGTNTTDKSASHRIEWTGGTTTPIVLRGTQNTPNPETLENVNLEGFLLLPSTNGDGDTAVFIDGENSAVRDSRIDIGVFGWGGTNPVIHGAGTIFGLYATPRAFSCSGDVFVVERSGSAYSGPPSETYVINPQIHSDSGYYAIRLEGNTGCVLNGRVQQRSEGAHGIAVEGAMQVFGTKLEANDHDGTYGGGIGIHALNTRGGMFLNPSNINDYDYGIKLGDGGSDRTQDIVVGNPNYNTGTSDIWVSGTSGGANIRQPNKVLGYVDSIQNDTDRPSIYNTSELKTTATLNIAIDTTGLKTNTVFPGLPSWDKMTVSTVSLNDGSGGNVSDASITQPTAVEMNPSGGIDVVAEVLTASATSGATATLELEFVRNGVVA